MNLKLTQPQPVHKTTSRTAPALRRFPVALDGPAVIGAVTLLLFVLACLFVPQFATANNLRALMLSVSLVGIVAVGLSMITIVGRMFSLSLSAVVATATILFAATLHYGPWLALLIAVAFGVLTGLA